MKKIPFPQYHIIILIFHPIYCRGYRVVVGFTAIYVIQHYVINFVSELRQVVVPISSTNKTDRHDILTEILLKVALNTINPNPIRRRQHPRGQVNFAVEFNDVPSVRIYHGYRFKDVPLKDIFSMKI